MSSSTRRLTPCSPRHRHRQRPAPRRDLGVRSVRVATHCTEADIAVQHIAVARELGLDVAGFLMMSHMAEPDVLAQQATCGR